MEEEKYVFFNLLSKTSELHISQAFWQQQERHIPTMDESMVNFCSKWIVYSFFPYFLMSSYLQQCAKTTQVLKG